MKNFWTPDTLIAAIIVIGTLVLIALGIDGEVKAILGTATGYIFGRVAQSKLA